MIGSIFETFSWSSFSGLFWVGLIFILACTDPFFYSNVNSYSLINQQHLGAIWPKTINLLPAVLLVGVGFGMVAANTAGLSPWSPTYSAYAHLVMPTSLILWLTFLLVNMGKNMVLHLVPVNTPTALISFIVLIELVSIIIRPLTLTVRINSNLMSGHIVVGLLGSIFNPIHCNGVLLIGQLLIVLVIVLESFVAVIQGYVYYLLLGMYSEEYE